MSRTPDYVGEMALSVTEHEAEALLSRSGVVGDDLLEVAVILEAVRSRAMPEPEQDFSHLFEAAVRESRLTPIERFANQQISITDDWKPRLAKQLAIGALLLFALVTSTTGLAYAANGAGPGDLLYGVDRALEIVGIGDGGAGERLAEAQALVAGGNDVGPTTTTQAVDTQSNQAAIAIAEAAARLAEGPVGPQDNEAVQDLLDYIHGRQVEGLAVDDLTVSDLAHLIGNRPTDPGNSVNAPGQVKEDGDSARDVAPGQGNTEEPTTEDADTDDAPGNSGTAPGRDEEGPPGQQEDESPGNSENAPGQDDSSEATTGTSRAPGGSGTAPGQGGENPGVGPSGGGPPGQGGGD